MPAERVSPAGLNGRHYFELCKADMPRIGSAPCGAELSEYISNLQLVPRHLGAMVTLIRA